MREICFTYFEKKYVENRVSHIISKLISPSPIYPNDRVQVQKVHTTVLAIKKKKKCVRCKHRPKYEFRAEELFLQLCCCVSFWFWRGIIGFGFTYVVLVFWFWREIFFVLRKYILRVYDTVVRLC